MKPCFFCDTSVECQDIPGPSVTLACCADCSQRVDNTELERINISLNHMKYIMWCCENSDLHPEVFGRKIDCYA